MRTDEEVEKLVEDNVKLARHFAGQWALHYGANEAFSMALEGLWKAAKDFKCGTVPFGSYASLRIKWTMMKEKHRMSKAKRGGGAIHIPLDAPLSDDSDKTISDVFPDTQHMDP